MESTGIYIQYYKSPVGELVLGEYQGKLCLCDWRYRARREQVDEHIRAYFQVKEFELQSTPLLEAAKNQLEEYFQQKRRNFDLPLVFAGSDFQKQVWQYLISIPYGETTNYRSLSVQLGNPKAIRAVASANGANALAIVVPCHRVIGSNGQLVGYAGGIRAKEQLLKLEGALPQKQLSLW